ncbi:hypothetical protein D3OALGA1CA_1518 [Olavius algarvensis associated proteobacterium Delta 3]|nr:hypothetical protein D3OALGB2SA_319 [Olavius algarvensis associated proteobacterium Delta 3]CAB5102381.1 hypothetical protein D3OALGA1CA_1518 [Olavius algarvensis associated proteobacterium Delta 3]
MHDEFGPEGKLCSREAIISYLNEIGPRFCTICGIKELDYYEATCSTFQSHKDHICCSRCMDDLFLAEKINYLKEKGLLK